MQRKLVSPAIALVVGGVLACGSKDASPPPTPTASSLAATTSNSRQPTTASKPPDVTITETMKCSDTQAWTTGLQQDNASSMFELYDVRKGAGDCYDRVVFDVNGATPVGYHVTYVPVLTESASGRPVFVEGGAVLQVGIRAQLQGQGAYGHQPGKVLANSGDYFYTPEQLTGFKSLRAVRFANFFEGQSTIGIGVAKRLPFRVQMWIDDDKIAHVIVDIAHP